MKNIILFINNFYQNYKIELLILLLLLNIISPLENNLETNIAAISGNNIIKLRKVPSKYIWKDTIFNINNKVFTKILFEKIFNQFLKTIESKFTNDNYMFILFKVKYVNKQFSTIGKVQRINKLDIKWYIDFIIENMKFKSEYYNETQIEAFIFSYGFKDGIIDNKNNITTNVSYQNYKNNFLPLSMNPIDFGRLIIKNKIESWINYVIQNDKGLTINFNEYEKYNEIEFFKNGISLIKFTDNLINKNSFLRIIDNKNFYFKDNKQILFTSEMKTKFITKTVKAKKLTNNFLVLDIETFVQDNTLIPYLICYYDGKNTYSFWLGDYPTQEAMILDCLSSIFIRKYNGYNIYIHNLGKFYIIFLLK